MKNVIIREKQKYERIKENVRNVNEKQENMRLNSVNSRKKNKFVNMWLLKKYWTFAPSKNFFFCVCMYKIDPFALFTAQVWRKNGVVAIEYGG